MTADKLIEALRTNGKEWQSVSRDVLIQAVEVINLMREMLECSDCLRSGLCNHALQLRRALEGEEG